MRELCTAAGDKASLAIGMAGLVIDHAYHARIREASQLASEAWALAESLGDPTLTVGLFVPGIYAKLESNEFSDALRWSQQVIDLADDDPSKGDFIFGSPLAVAYTTRGMARYCLGRPGWRDDLREGLAMARSADPLSYAAAVSFGYFGGLPNGVLRPDDSAMREIEDALQIAERSGDDLAVANVQMALGIALAHRDTAAERDRGQKLLAEVGDNIRAPGTQPARTTDRQRVLGRVRGLGVEIAMTPSRSCTPPSTICSARDRLLLWGTAATGVLVETLLDRGAEGDVAEAEAAIDRLADAPADDGLAIRDIWLLRLRALLARAHGDDVAYRDLVSRYRAMAESLGFEGHIDWAEAMP